MFLTKNKQSKNQGETVHFQSFCVTKTETHTPTCAIYRTSFRSLKIGFKNHPSYWPLGLFLVKQPYLVWKSFVIKPVKFRHMVMHKDNCFCFHFMEYFIVINCLKNLNFLPQGMQQSWKNKIIIFIQDGRELE